MLLTSLQIYNKSTSPPPPKKDNIMQILDDSDDVRGANL
jgi:hypothetical protein